MPRFVNNPGNLGLVYRITKDNAVLMGVFTKPCIHLFPRGAAGVVGIDVECQTELMLACAGDGNPLFSQFFGLCGTISLCFIFLYFVLQDLLLFPGGAVSVGYLRIDAGISNIVENCLKVGKDSCSYPCL